MPLTGLWMPHIRSRQTNDEGRIIAAAEAVMRAAIAAAKLAQSERIVD